MSTIRRLLSARKIRKHNSLPVKSDGKVDLDLDLQRVNSHKRSGSKLTTSISSSSPSYQNDAQPVSGLPLTQSPTTSSASSSNNNLPIGRSRSRVRAKHERAKSLERVAAQSREASLARAEHRKNSYESVSDPLLYYNLCVSHRHRSYLGPTEG